MYQDNIQEHIRKGQAEYILTDLHNMAVSNITKQWTTLGRNILDSKADQNHSQTGDEIALLSFFPGLALYI